MRMTIEPIIIVEGKYDKIKLENIVNTLVVATDGFSIFKDKKAQQNLKTLAADRGAIILTDSDRAGFLIRNFLHKILGTSKLYDLYIPDIFGKENRKANASAEGKLGVEGMSDSLLQNMMEAFSRVDLMPKKSIRETDLFEYGLFGGSNSSFVRRELQNSLGLPARMNKNMLLKVLNLMFSKEQFEVYMTDFLKTKGS